jgi:hypothetical protein
MSNSKDGGPAFPNLKANDSGPRDARNGGMSLRDWFAGQVIAGRSSSDPKMRAGYARSAYAMADAMLAEREKGGAE